MKFNGKFSRLVLNKASGIMILCLLISIMLVNIAEASFFAYVTNEDSNSISVIDTGTNKVAATIPVGSNPTAVAINPNGTKMYVANSHSNNLSVIDTATNAVTSSVRVGNAPEGLAISPDGKKVYVANLVSNTVSIIDATTNTLTGSINTGKSPAGIILSLDGKKIYVTNSAENKVSILDAAKKAVISEVPVGKGPEEIAVTPDGTKLYVVNSDGSSISVIDTATNSVINTVKVEGTPSGISITPDGTGAYVTVNAEYFSKVCAIDTATNKITATIPVGTGPKGIAVTPDGKKAYVANSFYNTVSVIDIETNTITATMPVGKNPHASGQFVASIPAQPVYPSANFSTGISSGYVFFSSPVQFTDLSRNATLSTWDFGDGARSTEKNPAHAYSAPGIYTVSLTVSNPNGTDSMSTTVNVVTKSSPVLSYAYITNFNSNSVSVIDAGNNTLKATIPVGTDPLGVAISPDGSRAYVTNSNYGDTGTVSVIDTARSKVVSTVNIGYKYYPCGIAVTPDGKKLFVADRDINGVSVIDAATNTVIATIPAGGIRPLGVAVSPDGKKVYVANRYSNDVSVIDTSKNIVISTIKVGLGPCGLAVNQKRTELYVTNCESNDVSIVNTSSDTVAATLPVGKWPMGIAVSPDGSKVYVTNERINSVSVIDATTKGVVANITVGKNPYGISVAPDGTQIYVANSGNDDDPGNTVSVIDATTNRVVKKINVGFIPIALGQFMSPIPPQPALPVANFSSNYISGNAPLSVQFTDFSKNVEEWKWDFGDDTSSAQQNPEHTYSRAGNYKVTLSGNNKNGTDSKLIMITVLAQPGFSASPTSGKAPFTVSFTDQSTGSPGAWNWDFGDGTSSTDKNPRHTYSKSGKYAVTLTLNETGIPISVTKSSYVIVSNSFEPPAASFSATPLSGNAPLTVSFTDESTGSLTRWKWTFGDGADSTEENPEHKYDKPGLYPVTLMVSNADGSTALTKADYIVVSNSLPAPVTGFSASKTSGKAPLTVNFTDQSKGFVTSWRWAFGDGNSSADKDSEHIYNKSGLYSVKLTASNEEGSNTLTKSNYIAVSGLPNVPVSRFSASPTFGKAPLTVSFTDQSTGVPTSRKWNFGDGNNSKERNPVYTYNKSGLYAVTLTASNTNGSNALTKTGYIAISDVSEVSITPVSRFSASPTSGKVPLTVNFTDESTGSPTSWRWAFGDGNTSNEKNPVHTYNKSGNYTIALTTTNEAGSNKLQKIGYVNLVSNLVSNSSNAGTNSYYVVPATAFKAVPTTGGMPLTVGFTDQSTGSPTSWKWTFGDGNNSTERNPVHIYGKSGKYPVTLTTNNANGSNALTKSGYILVANTLPAPVSTFSVNPASGSMPLTVSFTDQSTGSPASWRWTFGDGNTLSEKNPVHTYNKSGRYTVSLTAGNSDGSNTLTRSSFIAVSSILSAPVTSFSASPTSGKAPLTVNFADQSTGFPTGWKWTFGDGNNSTEKNPVYTYNKSGLYPVTLTASNENGTNVLTRSSYIAVSGIPNTPVSRFSASSVSGAVPLTVSFTDQSTGIPSGWRWNFGDGNISTENNPVNTYNKSGLYAVTLTVSNTNGSNALTKTGYIAVSNFPEAAFSASPTPEAEPLTVSFTDQSTGAPTGWKWVFGMEIAQQRKILYIPTIYQGNIMSV